MITRVEYLRRVVDIQIELQRQFYSGNIVDTFFVRLEPLHEFLIAN